MHESVPGDQDSSVVDGKADSNLRRHIVIAHFVIGLLLVGLSSWSQFFRVFLFPLFPCLALGWFLVAAALYAGRPGLANVATLWHVLLLLGAALLAAMGLFMAWPSTSGHTPHDVGAVLAPAFGVVMLVGSGVAAGISTFLLLLIRRLTPRSGADKDRATRAALLMSIGSIAFVSAAGGAQHVYEQHRRERVEQDVVEHEKTVAHPEGLGLMAFSPDGRILATCSSNSYPAQTRLWDPSTGQLADSISRQFGQPLSLAFSPDSRKLVFGYPWVRESVVSLEVWELADGDLRLHEPISTGRVVRGVAVSPNGQLLAVCSTDGDWDSAAGSLSIWDLPNSRHVFTSEDGTGFGSVSFSHDGQQLAVWRQDAIDLWNVPLIPGDNPVASIPWGGNVGSLSYSRDGEQLAAISMSGLKILGLTDRTEVRLSAAPQMMATNTIAVSPDGTLVAIEDKNVAKQTLLLVDWARDVVLKRIVIPYDIYRLAISADNSMIAVGGYQRVQLYDAASGKLVRELASGSISS